MKGILSQMKRTFTNTSSPLQKENPVMMQYFPSEGRIDKMYFPYYGKNAHVSIYLWSD